VAEYEPKAGWYSRWTQKIVNGLPSWNKIRRQRDSVGQQLVNAAAGKHVEHAWNEMERALRNRYPGTVEVNQPDLVTRVGVPQGVAMNPPTKVYNQVLNSSFEVWPNQAELPQFWQYSGTGTTAVVSTGFVGNRALQLSATLGQAVTVYQDIALDIPAGQEWTFSAWYSIDSSLSLTAPATGFGIEVVGYLVDNTTETLRTAFATDTNGRASKVSVTGSFTKAVTKIRISFLVKHTAGFTFSDTVTVDLAQVEEGEIATSWRPNPLDNWPHVTIHHDLSPVWLEDGNRAQFVESMEDFWLKAVPTRAAYETQITDDGPADSAPAPVGGVTSYGTAGRFVETDVLDEDWLYTVEAYSAAGTHSLRMIGTDVPDILGVFGMAFRNWRNWFEDDTSIVLEAITYFGGWLWVVHKKNDFLGAQKRYLSVVDVRTPWPRPSYLEVLATIELPTPSLGTLVTRLEFRYDDQQHIYVGDGLTTHVYTLHYDYFMIRNRFLLLREDPASIAIIEAEPRRRKLTTAQDASKMDRTRR
jgi:hypothetical protein